MQVTVVAKFHSRQHLLRPGFTNELEFALDGPWNALETLRNFFDAMAFQPQDRDCPQVFTERAKPPIERLQKLCRIGWSRFPAHNSLDAAPRAR